MESPLIHIISRHSFPHSFLVSVIQGRNCCLFGVYGTSDFLVFMLRMTGQFFGYIELELHVSYFDT